jgi:hypothetical protein
MWGMLEQMKDPDPIKGSPLRRTDVLAIGAGVLGGVGWFTGAAWQGVVALFVICSGSVVAPRLKGRQHAKLTREGAEINSNWVDPADFDEPGDNDETKLADADEKQSDEGRQSA